MFQKNFKTSFKDSLYLETGCWGQEWKQREQRVPPPHKREQLWFGDPRRQRQCCRPGREEEEARLWQGSGLRCGQAPATHSDTQDEQVWVGEEPQRRRGVQALWFPRGAQDSEETNLVPAHSCSILLEKPHFGSTSCYGGGGARRPAGESGRNRETSSRRGRSSQRGRSLRSVPGAAC